MSLSRKIRRLRHEHHTAFGILMPLLILAVAVALVFLVFKLLTSDGGPDPRGEEISMDAPLVSEQGEAASEDNGEGTEASRELVQHRGDSVDTAWLFKKHLQAVGGYGALTQMKSLRRLGKSYEGDKVYEVTAFNKDPHFLRLSLVDENANIRIAYNGEIAWYQLVRDAQPGPVMAVSDYRQMEIARNIRYKSPLYADPETPLPFEYEGEVERDGETFYRMVRNDDQAPEEVYLDKETFLARHHFIDMSKLSQEERNIHIILEDYRSVSGVQIPYEESSFVNGEPASSFVLEHADTNPGLPSVIFSPPEKPKTEAELKKELEDRKAAAEKAEAAQRNMEFAP